MQVNSTFQISNSFGLQSRANFEMEAETNYELFSRK